MLFNPCHIEPRNLRTDAPADNGEDFNLPVSRPLVQTDRYEEANLTPYKWREVGRVSSHTNLKNKQRGGQIADESGA
jgi:hypothetical protein